MSDRTMIRPLAAAILAAAAALYGCASSDLDQTATATTICEGQDQNDCEARDNARQVRDAQDYKDEPALGYIASPPGLLPVPLTARNGNTSSN